jgi:hypothetical protein
MKIKKKDTFGIIDSQEEKEKISYCSRCLKFNFISVLGERIYLPNQPIASDHDLWKQCHECGTIAPIYELKKESKLKDFVETSDNPFDSGQSITGLGNKSSTRKLTESQKKMKKLKERIEKEKDIDIKQELKKGNEVSIIE